MSSFFSSRAKVMISLIVVLVILLGLGTTTVVVWGIFYKRSDAGPIQVMARAFPIPAAKVGKRVILYRDYLTQRETLKRFLASPAAVQQQMNVPLDAALEKNILEKLVTQKAMEELAEQKAVTVNDEELRAYFADVLTAVSSTTPDVGLYLYQNFGWNEEDFRQQVLRPALLEQKLGQQMAVEQNGDAQALAAYLDQRLKKSDVVRYLKF